MGVSLTYGSDLETTDSSKLFRFSVLNHAALSSLVDVEEGDLAYVKLSTGVRFINQKVQGLYEFVNGVWKYGSQELQDQLILLLAEIQANEDQIILNDTEILALQQANTGDETISTIQTKRPLKTVNGETIEGGGDISVGGVSDHGGLTGLEDDDHPQYLTETRGDARYYTEGEIDSQQQTQDNALISEASIRQIVDEGIVDVHSNVTLADGVIPKDGWVAKSVNGILTFCMKEQAFYRGNPIVNINANNPSGNTNLEFDFNFQRTGHYMITIKANESIDVTSSDIIIRPVMDGGTLTTRQNGEILRREGKDNQGNDNDGRGTDQKNQMGSTYYYNNPTLSTKTLRIDHYPSVQGQEAAIWDVFIEVEEIFNPIIRN